MSFVTIKLADLFRAKTKQDSTKKTASEGADGEADKKETPKDSGKDGEGDSDGEADKKDGDTKPDDKKEADKKDAPKESDQADGEDDLEGESDGTADAKNGDTLTMTASAFNTMKTNAAEYVKVKGELETLRGWKASIDKMNGGLGRADQSDRNGKNKPSVLDTPWNKAAVDAAERLK